MKRIARGIPHSSLLAKHHDELLDELKLTLDTFLAAARIDKDQRSVFKVCTAAHSVLRVLGDSQGLRLLSGAAGTARRFAVLATIRQVSLARVELRRLIECVIWFAYFVDHPVEFAAFSANPGRSWDVDADRPIEAISRSPISFFFKYSQERAVAASPSVVEMVNTLKVGYGDLSGQVHAAMGALSPSATLSQAQDPYDNVVAAALRNDADRIMTAAVATVAAFDVRLLAALPVVERSWFDWLVGTETANAARAAQLGIERT